MHPDSEVDRLKDLLQQHLTEFYQAVETQAERSVVVRLFDKVINDSNRLFQQEERYLRRNWSPDIESHRQRHKALLGLAAHVRIHLELAGKDAAQPALLFAEEWLEQHLRGVDQPFLSVAA